MRESIGKLVQSAIKTVGDIAEPIVYNARASGSYDTDTGEISEDVSTYPLNAVISFKGMSSNNSYFPSKITEGYDLSALFASIDLPITPNTGDTITRGVEVYKIKQIELDPAGASTTLFVAKI